MSISASVLALCLLTTDAPTQVAPIQVPSDFDAKATEYLKARATARGFNGVVLIALNGQPIVRRAFGMASRDFGVPNAVGTKFRIGSVTKQFTAAAILRLEQEGKLKLTDKVSAHLSDWPRPWDAMTIHHLLSHTGGFPALKFDVQSNVSGLTSPSWQPRFTKFSDYLAPGEERLEPDFVPGESWMYSNIGYVALGLIVEKVSGLPYSDFLAQRFFTPLGMAHTGCEEPQTIIPGGATGYALKAGVYEHVPFVDMRIPGGAGQIYSTIDDMLLWNNALAANKVLSKAETAKLFTPVQNGYGYGWWINKRFGRGETWHRGNVNGFVAINSRYSNEGLSIIVLSNVERTPVRAMANELAAIAFGQPYEIPVELKQAAIRVSSFDAYLGSYTKESDPSDHVSLVRNADELALDLPLYNASLRLVPMARDWLFSPGSPLEFQIRIVNDKAGKFSHLLISNEGETSKWLKAPGS